MQYLLIFPYRFITQPIKALVFQFLLAMRPLLIDQGSGGAQPNISKTKIEKFPFALPPFEEQKRIVTKIEKLMPLLVE